MTIVYSRIQEGHHYHHHHHRHHNPYLDLELYLNGAFATTTTRFFFGGAFWFHAVFFLFLCGIGVCLLLDTCQDDDDDDAFWYGSMRGNLLWFDPRAWWDQSATTTLAMPTMSVDRYNVIESHSNNMEWICCSLVDSNDMEWICGGFVIDHWGGLQALSRPMTEILDRLQQFGEFEVPSELFTIIFTFLLTTACWRRFCWWDLIFPFVYWQAWKPFFLLSSACVFYWVYMDSLWILEVVSTGWLVFCACMGLFMYMWYGFLVPDACVLSFADCSVWWQSYSGWSYWEVSESPEIKQLLISCSPVWLTDFLPMSFHSANRHDGL